MKHGKVEKGLKHGRNMEDGCMGWGQNIALEMLHVLLGICFEGSSCLAIETRAKPLVET
jgi:hypothetical protein